MLTADEKHKIRLEEEFRADVRKDIEARKTKGKGTSLIEFLNTNLGMWILGTVVVGLASLLWSTIAKNIEESRVTSQRIGKIYVELAHRFADAEGALREIENEPVDVQSSTLLVTGQKIILTPLQLRKASGVASSPFDEFQQRTMRALLVELSTLGDNKDLKNATEIELSVKAIASELDEEQPKVEKLRKHFIAARKYYRRSSTFVFF